MRRGLHTLTSLPLRSRKPDHHERPRPFRLSARRRRIPQRKSFAHGTSTGSQFRRRAQTARVDCAAPRRTGCRRHDARRRHAEPREIVGQSLRVGDTDFLMRRLDGDRGRVVAWVNKVESARAWHHGAGAWRRSGRRPGLRSFVGMLKADEEYAKFGEPLFSSHMLDLSEEDHEENVSICADYLKRMAPMKLILEMEIGNAGNRRSLLYRLWHARPAGLTLLDFKLA